MSTLQQASPTLAEKACPSTPPFSLGNWGLQTGPPQGWAASILGQANLRWVLETKEHPQTCKSPPLWIKLRPQLGGHRSLGYPFLGPLRARTSLRTPFYTPGAPVLMAEFSLWAASNPTAYLTTLPRQIDRHRDHTQLHRVTHLTSLPRAQPATPTQPLVQPRVPAAPLL